MKEFHQRFEAHVGCGEALEEIDVESDRVNNDHGFPYVENTDYDSQYTSYKAEGHRSI